MVELEFTVIAIHGEGDRDTVNKLQDHRNKEELLRHQAHSMMIPPKLMQPADEPPDVVVVLRDEHHNFRIEWPVMTWPEVEEWKRLAGYDYGIRHWIHGNKVKVRIGG